MKESFILPLLLVLMLMACPVAAEIHRCTDAAGVVTFSDTPCGETATVLKPFRPASPTEESLRNDKRDRLLRAFEEERRLEREQIADEKAERAKRTRKCHEAKNDLRIMKRAGSLYDLDEAGNRVYLSDAQRAEAIGDTEAAVKHWCN